MNTAKLTELKARLAEASDLEMAAMVLSWDQQTYMPPGGAAARGRQLSLLSRLSHEKFTDPEVGRLLDALGPDERARPFDDDDASLIRATRRKYEKLTRVPAGFMARLSDHLAATYQVWTEARPADDFARVQPYLEKTLELSRELSRFHPHEHLADPLIDAADEGMTVKTVRALFAELRAQLVPMVEAIVRGGSSPPHPAKPGEPPAQAPADRSCLRQHFPEAEQLGFGLDVVRGFGYDFSRGRQDKTHHPFMTKFSLGDVRITTRVDEGDLGDAMFSTMHEAGHAMYEQGIAMAFDGTPLGNGTSSGVHESQSRTWENIVGRSRGFWEHFYPKLQAVFPAQLGGVGLDTFYRAINKVEPSLIRTDADEVTYNLHVMIRFDLELALLEGKLAVRDLPAAWRARYQSDLGVSSPGDQDGVLQDVHWFAGPIGGAFQSYTLGNVMSAQIYEAAVQACPEVPAEIRAGRFAALHGWLVKSVYAHGSKYTADELIPRVTGRPLSIEPYLRYLRGKYGELYQL